LARAGMSVALLEKSPFLGGRVMQSDRVFPTEEKARDLVKQLLDEVIDNPNITVHTQAEIVEASGYVGDFRLSVKLQPRGVDDALSDADLDVAVDACLVRVPSESDFGLRQRKAIYRPHPESYPRSAAIDWENCERCGECMRAVGGKGISLDDSPEVVSLHTGALVLATGYDLYQPKAGEFGYVDHPEVVTLGQLERLLDPEGPTSGRLEENGKPIRNICLIHCVGSRQTEGIHEPGSNDKLNEYCSRVCCTATLRAAAELRRRFPKTNVFELYQDIRSYGRNHEQYYDDATRERVIFVRYTADQPPIVSRNEGADGTPLSVSVKDTLTFGEELDIPADLVVLATGMVPRDLDNLIDQLKLSRSADGYLQELHPKLRPVELAVSGVFVAGTCQAPMDIAESCTSGAAAASKAVALLSRGHLELDPFRARVDTDVCRGDGKCVEVCEYQKAVALVEVERDGETFQQAEVNSALCNGCGMCVAVCPHQAIQVDGWHLTQFDAMVDALVADYS
jgi:heterodisulfide reductase subunit A2